MSKNIAIMISKLNDGGAEKVAANLSLELPSEYKIYIFLFDDEKIAYPYNGEIVKIKNNISYNIIGKCFDVFRRIIEIRKLKKKYKIDITISHLSGMNFYNILSKVNDKVIITEHSYVNKKGLSWKKLIFRKLYNRADKIVTVSNGVEKNLIDNYNIEQKKIKTIYNFFDFEQIKSMRDECLKEKNLFENPVIINVGRLAKPKGQWHLIKIFSKVRKEIPNAKLVFLGKGPLQNELEELSIKLNIEEDVVFLGFKNNPYKYIKKSKVFAFTSLWEGFGNVLIEAMMSDTPVISTDCKAGPREIIAPEIQKEVSEVKFSKYGVLTPAFDDRDFDFSQTILNRTEKEYTKALIKLMKTNKLLNKYRENQKERIKDFIPKNIIKDWEEVINS